MSSHTLKLRLCTRDCAPGGPLDVNNDCGEIIEYSWINLYDDVKECCQQEVGWQDPDLCASESNPSSTGTNKFYVIQQEEKCAQDCDSLNGLPCGGGPTDSSAQLFDTAAACCNAKLSWMSQESCLTATTGVVDPSAGVGSGEWYVDFEVFKCVRDCVQGESCGGLKGSSAQLFDTAVACCDAELSWISQEDCLTMSGVAGLSAAQGSGEWYLDFTRSKCARDCVQGESCGGLKKFWESTHATEDACCDQLFWVERSECVI